MTTRLIILIIAACLTNLVFGDETSKVKTARDVLAKYQDSIVGVSATIKVQMTGLGIQFGPAQEQKVEIIGTVIDSSGLVVVSHTSLDPTALMGGMSFRMDTEDQKVEMKSSFSDVKIHLSDGDEIPAKLVLKDVDLDLAFVSPDLGEDEEMPTFTPLKAEKAADAQILDELILIGRLGKDLNRAPTLRFSRISSVVTKPRTFYSVAIPGQMGTPAFDLNGKLLGFGVIRIAKGSGGATDGGQSVILPVDDVMEIARQALNKKE